MLSRAYYVSLFVFINLTLLRDNKFKEKFAKRVFEHWATLKPQIPRFKEKWEEYRIYMSQIPSNGALIYNINLEKLLFIIYHNPRERIARKLDFPKGKVD